MIHLFQFAVFFVLMTRSLRSTSGSPEATLAGAFAAVLLLSLANESVQKFTPTRTFDFLDMAMDVAGGLVGLSVVMFRDGSRAALQREAPKTDPPAVTSGRPRPASP